MGKLPDRSTNKNAVLCTLCRKEFIYHRSTSTQANGLAWAQDKISLDASHSRMSSLLRTGPRWLSYKSDGTNSLYFRLLLQQALCLSSFSLAAWTCPSAQESGSPSCMTQTEYGYILSLCHLSMMPQLALLLQCHLQIAAGPLFSEQPNSTVSVRKNVCQALCKFMGGLDTHSVVKQYNCCW